MPSHTLAYMRMYSTCKYTHTRTHKHTPYRPCYASRRQSHPHVTQRAIWDRDPVNKLLGTAARWQCLPTWWYMPYTWWCSPTVTDDRFRVRSSIILCLVRALFVLVITWLFLWFSPSLSKASPLSPSLSFPPLCFPIQLPPLSYRRACNYILERLRGLAWPRAWFGHLENRAYITAVGSLRISQRIGIEIILGIYQCWDLAMWGYISVGK